MPARESGKQEISPRRIDRAPESGLAMARRNSGGHFFRPFRFFPDQQIRKRLA